VISKKGATTTEDASGQLPTHPTPTKANDNDSHHQKKRKDPTDLVETFEKFFMGFIAQ